MTHRVLFPLKNPWRNTLALPKTRVSLQISKVFQPNRIKQKTIKNTQYAVDIKKTNLYGNILKRRGLDLEVIRLKPIGTVVRGVYEQDS